MSSTADRPDRPPTARLFEALQVKRNAAISLVVGVVFTLVVFLFFVVIPGSGQTNYLLALGFVLAVTTAGSVLIVLTVYRTIQLSRELEDVE
ncbi:hypothetical protein OB919_03395 [Halobacteria archaeon AArc-curdl1]|uniref:Uncharacterized protein n=1 Tax=Natronosalvus hydrolyticus TaxID=2979988 RepID=A0AAP3E509_9EURY|nr:hypothetical protein [Halobacteria archaeon AArc-curdl1]